MVQGQEVRLSKQRPDNCIEGEAMRVAHIGGKMGIHPDFEVAYINGEYILTTWVNFVESMRGELSVYDYMRGFPDITYVEFKGTTPFQRVVSESEISSEVLAKYDFLVTEDVKQNGKKFV